MLILIIPCGISYFSYLALTKRKLIQSIVYFVVVLAFLFIIYANGRRSLLLGLLAISPFWIYWLFKDYLQREKNIVPKIFFSRLLIYSLVIYLFFGITKTSLDTSQPYEHGMMSPRRVAAATSRMWIWSQAAEMIASHPWLGIGNRNYEDLKREMGFMV